MYRMILALLLFPIVVLAGPEKKPKPPNRPLPYEQGALEVGRIHRELQLSRLRRDLLGERQETHIQQLRKRIDQRLPEVAHLISEDTNNHSLRVGVTTDLALTTAISVLVRMSGDTNGMPELCFFFPCSIPGYLAGTFAFNQRQLAIQNRLNRIWTDQKAALPAWAFPQLKWLSSSPSILDRAFIDAETPDFLIWQSDQDATQEVIRLRQELEILGSGFIEGSAERIVLDQQTRALRALLRNLESTSIAAALEVLVPLKNAIRLEILPKLRRAKPDLQIDTNALLYGAVQLDELRRLLDFDSEVETSPTPSAFHPDQLWDFLHPEMGRFREWIDWARIHFTEHSAIFGLFLQVSENLDRIHFEFGNLKESYSPTGAAGAGGVYSLEVLVSRVDPQEHFVWRQPFTFHFPFSGSASLTSVLKSQETARLFAEALEGFANTLSSPHVHEREYGQVEDRCTLPLRRIQ